MDVVVMYIQQQILGKGVRKMPKVGNKKFDYTPQGVAAAKKESAATGIPMSDGAMRSEQKYAGGGQVGFDRIGQDLGPKINTGNTVPDFSYDDVPSPGYGDNPIESHGPSKHVGDRHWFDDPRKGGGAYKEGGEVKKNIVKGGKGFKHPNPNVQKALKNRLTEKDTPILSGLKSRSKKAQDEWVEKERGKRRLKAETTSSGKRKVPIKKNKVKKHQRAQ